MCLGIDRECAQIARVALERVIGQPPFDPQMVQVCVDHRPGYANIRGFRFMSAVQRRRPSVTPVRSKWQSLPTEAINPATLAIDKLSSADIVEGMLNED